MYIQRRYPFRSVLIWTKRELIFFAILSAVYTLAYELLGIKWLQVPLAPVGLIGTAVAFMVGFQNNSAYDRIWEARTIWGGIVNISRSFIITMKDSFYIHNHAAAKDESATIRVITHRHIAWLTALRYALRSKRNWEASYADMHQKISFQYHVPEFTTPLEEALKPWLSEEEFKAVMAAEHKPNVLLSLQSKHLRSLSDERKIWDFSLLSLQAMIKEMMEQQGKAERIKNFPYPKQYGSIGYHFVHIFMWLLPMAIIPSFAEMGVGMMDSNPMVGQYFVWLSIPFSTTVIWVFNTMLRIGLAGENPFEGSPNDVPISNISRGITRDVLELIGEDAANIPEPFENINHVQM